MQSSAAIIDAIKAGDLAQVKALVTADPALVDARGAGGESAFLTAVYHRRRDIADLLRSRGATMTLFDACAGGEWERADELIGGGAPVNATSADGWTPLHLAAFFGHARLVELLLEHGASPAARSANANGNTPLHSALAGNHKMVAGLLIGAGADVNAADADGWRPLHLATANHNVDVMKALIAQGAEVTAANGKGQTPLALAMHGNHREAEALLRRHGG